MGSRKTHEGAERVYAAAELWVDRALRRDDSLFTPGKPIWTRELLGMAREHWMESTVEVDGGFHDRLRVQLADSPKDLLQLMGEALYVHFLVIHSSNMKGDTKQKHIDTILQWSSEPVQIPEKLIQSLQQGIGGTGVQFLMGRPYHLGFLIEFAEEFKGLGTVEQELLLGDPWKFKKFVMDMNFRSHWLRDSGPDVFTMQREALFHLIFPDTFERVFPPYQKEQIAESFADLVDGTTDDVDRKLSQIRQALEKKQNRGFDFYDPNVRAHWDSSFSPWDEFVRQAKAYFESGRLEPEELEYKLDTGQKLAAAREAVLMGTENWQSLIEKGLYSNLVTWRDRYNLNEWFVQNPVEGLRAIRTLWAGDESTISERIDRFSALLPTSVCGGSGTRMRLFSVLLMGLDAQLYPPFMTTVFHKAYLRTGYGQPQSDSDESTLYSHALGFLEHFIQEASKRGLQIENRLVAQSLVWGVLQDRVDPPPPPLPSLPVPLETLADEVFLPVEFLEEIEMLLTEQKQVIFQGPPGTGKTFVAQKLAQHLAGGDESRVTLVQFHPSYAYEDFVQGHRPTQLDNGQPGFELKDGPLRKMAKQAVENPGVKHYLIIDEINRGNIAKVFGELYFLLEYRDQEIDLLYSNEKFSLPENLYIIGTMNTADRSIALVDLALRRRFYFVGFHPDDREVGGVLRKWLRAKAEGMEWVADVVDEVNERMKDDRHAAIGPSYFMKDKLDDAKVERIWRHSVLPYIEERRFGGDTVSDEFDLKKLRPSTKTAESGDAVQEQQGDDENG